MNNDRKLKVLVLSLGLILGMMMPEMAHAQCGGGLFGYGREVEQQQRESLFNAISGSGFYNLYNQQFGDNQYGGYNLYNQTFGQEVPLGSGLLILSVAGAGYALCKRKNNEKN